jgi:cyclopropane-fatty-acyl-phospholipid synthase
VHDSFAFGQHYAKTLQHWLNNFDAQSQNLKALGFDQGFMRMWRFYLAYCIAGFMESRVNVYQFELHHD